MTKPSETKPGDPLLRRVASHERSLLSRIAGARQAAQSVIEDARARARVFLEDDDRALGAETQAFRRDAEAARTTAYEQTVRAAEAETAQDRARVAEHAGAVAGEVLAMILPGGSE